MHELQTSLENALRDALAIVFVYMVLNHLRAPHRKTKMDVSFIVNFVSVFVFIIVFLNSIESPMTDIFVFNSIRSATLSWLLLEEI